MTESSSNTLQVAIAQIEPVLLNRQATTQRIVKWIHKAAAEGNRLVAFGEALLPGYPFWLSLTGGARFNDAQQKAWHALYMDQAVHIPSGHLAPICEAARTSRIWVVLGCVERAEDRGNHSLYCTLFTVDDQGKLRSAHRKLMPTYEERLAWAPGDGAGLVTHELGSFTLGSLNCWENWLPMARACLHAQGENLHVASWPGSESLTGDITRFMALEGRSFIVSASGLMHRDSIPGQLPQARALQDAAGEWLADGGSAMADPAGNWLIAPHGREEALLSAEIHREAVFRERQNLDISGHYSRPDVLSLRLNRERRSVLDEVPKDH